MSMVELLKSKRNAGRKVTSPTNETYFKLCIQQGKEETKEIMKDYALALKEASNIYIR